MIDQYINSTIHRRVVKLATAVARRYISTPASRRSIDFGDPKEVRNTAPVSPGVSVQVTNEELDELFYVVTKMKTNTETPPLERLTLQLIGKKLVVRDGNIVRITNKGKDQLRLAFTG